MMHRVPFIFGRIKRHQWEVSYPEKIQLVRIRYELSELSHLQPKSPQHGTDGFPTIRAEKDKIALLDPHFVSQRLTFGLGEKLHDGRLPFSIFDLDKGQSLGAGLLSQIGYFFYLAGCDIGEPLCIDRLHHAFLIQGRSEYLELTVSESLTEINQLCLESEVRFVAAEAVHRFLIS